MKTYFLDVLMHHYVDFSGRATRKQYWMFILFLIIVFIPINVVLLLILSPKLMILETLALFLPVWGITTRRVRDAGFSPWWVLAAAIPSTIISIFGQFITIPVIFSLLYLITNLIVFIFTLLPSKN